jgi:DNA-directed RNA polymerase II subunit RPB1
MMNVIICSYYNADFDGDQMNLIFSPGSATRHEIHESAGVANWAISHTTSGPAIGQVDDSVIGLARLTRGIVKFNKYNAMLLFGNSTLLPSFSEMTTNSPTISGRDCITKLLAETPINYTRVPQYYDSNVIKSSPWIQYDPTDTKVTIVNGKMMSGILDKRSIGKGANGGVYHIIANEHGRERALEVMFNMQQVAIGYNMQQGYTVGIRDLLIDLTAKKEVDNIAAQIINKSLLITEQLHSGMIIPPIGQTVEQHYEDLQSNTLRILDDFAPAIMKSIDPPTNNLFNMVMTGSKGEMNHMHNAVSAVGQKFVNGERMRYKFGPKRTLVYYTRFDPHPLARGYIMNSYLSGMNTREYISNAFAARFDLISKALSTSVTGEQNRKSIKNLESIITNYFRWSTKNFNIVELAYGEDFLDARRVENVKFPTVMSSDVDFNKMLHPDFLDFGAKMAEDRRKYRDIFLRLEQMSVKDLMSDVRKMPVDIERMIVDITREFNEELKEPTIPILKEMVNTINEFCEDFGYLLVNKTCQKLRAPLFDYIRSAVWLMQMLIRSYLNPAAMLKAKLTPVLLGLIIDKICLRYSQALVEPGTAVGIIAAQSFSEPLTQYMLDAHHRSASGGTSKSGMVRTKEVLGARDVSLLINPSMLVIMKPEFSTSEDRVREIANHIEVMKFSQFVIMWQIFFEKFGEPVHSQTVGERDLIAKFLKTNPLLLPPADLTKWCIRFVLDKTTLILKNMSLEYIVTRLRDLLPDAYIVYNPENSPTIILRIYFRNIMFKLGIGVDDVRSVCDNILEFIIRGVEGCISANATKLIRNKINDDGSISRDENMWGVNTIGTNLSGVMTIREVDGMKTHTDAIMEMAAVFGIEAARYKIISGMRDIMHPPSNHRHYLVYADEMTYTGRVTSIEFLGLKMRESANVLLRIGYSSPIAVIQEAAINALEDRVSGITAPLLVGNVPRHGTLYTSFHVNPEFVKKHVKRPEDIVEQLF